MSTIADAVEKHRRRIAAEVEAALWHSNKGFRALGRERLVHFIHRAIDALVARTDRADDPALPALLGDLLRGGEVPPHVVLAGLNRLALTVRTVLLFELNTRRAASIASAAVDRAVAESIEELRADEWPIRSATSELTRVMPARDPTILRNIREVLGAGGGGAEDVTVVAVSLRAARDEPDAAPTHGIAAMREECAAGFRQAGAQLVLSQGDWFVGLIATRVDDTDVEDAIGLAIGLGRTNALRSAAFGLARGRVELERAADGETTAMGAPLRRAMGLAAVAREHQILLDAELRDLADTTFVLRPEPSVTGAVQIDMQQPQWIDRWQEAALVVEPELVGRDEQREALRAALRTADGSVALVGLRGRAGIGKQRLAEAALAAEGVRAERVLVGEPHPFTPEPYWVIGSLTRQLLGLGDEPLEGPLLRERVEALAQTTPAALELRGSTPTLAALLAAEAVSESFGDDSDAPVVRAAIAKAFRQLIEAVAAQRPGEPLVLVLRDAHRLDGPTSHALGHVAQHYHGAAPLWIVLCYSGVFRLPTALHGAKLRELAVKPLERGDVERLACSMLDTEELSATLAKLLHERTDGSPLGVAALVRHLVESATLERRSGGWSLSEHFDRDGVPRRLPTLLARRIEHLPAKLAGLLETAATFGEPLAWRTLELLWVSRGLSRDTLEQSIGLLQELGFLQRGRDEQIRFSHPLLRQVAYRRQAEEARRDAHRLAVVAYQERHPDAARQMPAVLFRHFLEAGDAEGARDTAVAAVRRAVQLQDFKGGMSLAAKGLATCADGSTESRRARFDILAARERIHDTRGARAEQRRDLQEMTSLAESLHDTARLGAALHRASRLNLLLGDVGRAAVLAERALQLLESGSDLDRSNALRTLALVRWHKRDPAGAASALREALEIYERLGHRRGMGFVLHNLGLFALDTGALGQARSHFDRALALKLETDDQHGRAVILDALGQVAQLESDRESAARFYRDAISLRAENGDLAGAAASRVNLGEALLASEPSQAEALARAALTATRQKKRHARTHIEALVLLTRALLAQGKRDAAARPSARAVRRAEELGARLLSVRARIARAEVELAHRSTRRAERAAVDAQLAADSALAAGAVRWRIEAMSLLALAKAHAGSPEAAAVASEVLTLLSERTPVGLDTRLIRERCAVAAAPA